MIMEFNVAVGIFHPFATSKRKEGNTLFNDALNTFPVIRCHTCGQ